MLNLSDEQTHVPAAVTRWTVPFQSREEAQAYLSGDSITCLLCGVDLQWLPKHLKDAHQVSPADYRRRFGVPRDLALISAKLRARCKRNLTPGRLAEMAAAARAARASRVVALPDRPVKPSPQSDSAGPAETFLAPPLPPPPDAPAFRFIGKEAIVDRQFQSMQEVDDYLSGPVIVCLICGKRLQRLQGHLQAAHDATPGEYQAEFGIPFSRGLVSAPSAARSRAIMMRPDRMAQILELSHRDRSGYGPHKPARPHSPAVRALWKKNSETGRYFAREFVTLPCTKCGKDVVTTRLGAVQSVTCLDCTTPGGRQARLSYWRSKWEAA